MTNVDQIEKAIEHLNDEELVQLRQWFAEFDHARWDQRLEADSNNGKLDALADEALGDLGQGRTREL